MNDTERFPRDADRYCAECGTLATQRVTVLVENNDGYSDTGRLVYRSYCTGCAAVVTEELAHGTPPDVELISVIAITPNWLRVRREWGAAGDRTQRGGAAGPLGCGGSWTDKQPGSE